MSSYCCWVPPNQKKICTDLSVNIGVTGTAAQAIYLFGVTNNGPLVAQNVILTVNFTGHPGLTFFPGLIFGSPPPIWQISTNTATLAIGTLNPGQTALYNLSGTPTLPFIQFIPGQSTMSATVISDTLECNTSNNTASSHFP